MSKRHIVLLIPTLAAGGAERVAVLLCNAWAQSGHRVDLVTYQAKDVPSAYPIDDGVTVHGLDLVAESSNILGRVWNNKRRLSALSHLLTALKPSCLIAFMTEANVLAVLAGKRAKVPVVISERTHPEYHVVPGFHRAMRKLTYRYADKLVVQSQAVADWYERALKLSDISIIENPIDLTKFFPPLGSQIDRPLRIVGVGRLDPGKAFDLLVEAFVLLAADFPDWCLTIFGEGPMRPQLEAMRDAAGLEARVGLPGVSSAIAEELRASSIFVSSSRYEGYPNAVMEALASGCCVIAADSPGALNALLDNGRRGILVPTGDSSAIAKALAQVMSDEQIRLSFTALGPLEMRANDTNAISVKWLELVNEVSGQD